MKRRLRFLTAVLVIILIFVMIPLQCFAEEPATEDILQWVNPADENAAVGLRQAAGALYLFLPASADYGCLPLRCACDAVLTAQSAQGVSISLSAGTVNTVDLTGLFGQMQPGVTYTAQLKPSTGLMKTVNFVKSANLRSLYVNIDKDLKLIDQSPDKSETATGSYVLLTAEGELYKTGAVGEFGGRGNSSWVRSEGKQPYNLKLETSDELIPGAGKSKKWCLVSDNVTKHDTTGLSNRVAMELYRQLDGLYALSSENIDLYVNNEYRGTYMLSEKVTLSDGSVSMPDSEYNIKDNVDRTLVIQPEGITAPPRCWDQVPLKGEELTVIRADSRENDEALAAGIQAYQYANNSVLSSMSGYLLEIDFRFYGETCWFITSRGYAFVIRDPKYASAAEVRKIAAAVQRAEDALFSENGYLEDGTYYAELMDLESFAKVYLVDSFTTNRDAHRASSFCTAELNPDGSVGILRAGPVWDYNSIALNIINFFGNDIGTISYHIRWMEQLVQHGDFLSLLQQKNEETVKPWVEGLRDSGLDSWIEELSASQYMNNLLWRNNFQNLSQQYKKDFTGRVNIWENSLWNGQRLEGVTAEYDRETGVLTAKVSGTAEAFQWYRVNENGDWSGTAIEGATESSYKPQEDGIYYVSATGPSLIYSGRAASNPSLYSVNGFWSLTGRLTTTITSNPINTAYVPEEPVQPEPEEPEPIEPTDEPEETEEETSSSAETLLLQPSVSEPTASSAEAEKEPTEEKSFSLPILPIAAAVAGVVILLVVVSAVKKRAARARRQKTAHSANHYQGKH